LGRSAICGVAVRITALDHLEPWRIHPMKRCPIIKSDLSQLQKVLAMPGSHLEIQLQLDLPVLGRDPHSRIFLHKGVHAECRLMRGTDESWGGAETLID